MLYFAGREQEFEEESKAQFDDGNSTDLFQGDFDNQGDENNRGNEDSTETPIPGFETSDYTADDGQEYGQDEYQEPEAQKSESTTKQEDEINQGCEEARSKQELQAEQKFEDPASHQMPEEDSSQRNQQDGSGEVQLQCNVHIQIISTSDNSKYVCKQWSALLMFM